MSEALQNIVLKAQRLSEEYEKVVLYGSESLINKWPDERQAHYFSGPIFGMLLDKEPEFIAYLHESDQMLEMNDLKRNILWLMRDCDKENRKIIMDVTKDGHLICELEKVLYDSSAEKYRDIINNAHTLEEIDNVFRGYNGEILKYLEDDTIVARMKYLFCYIEYRKFLFKKNQYRLFSQKQDELDALYDNYSEQNSEYRKYGLITSDSTREVFIGNPLYLVL